MRRTAAGGLLGAALMVTTACSSGTDGGSGADPGAAAEDGAAVVIDHEYGSAEISGTPERVVALGVTDVDPLLALGVVPVAAAGYSFIGEDPVGVWAEDLLVGDAPQFLESDSDVNVEEIAALQPDLIVAISSGIDQNTYDLLAQIAPTIARPAGTEPYTASREDATMMVAEALGKPDEGRALVDAADEAFAAAVEANPAFEGATGTVVLPYDGQYGAYTPDDTRGQFMDQLGFELPADLAARADGTYFVEVSRENLDQIESDVVLALVDDESSPVVADDEVLQGLDVAERGDLLVVGGDQRAALTYNTVLSVPYALEQLTPLLAGALTS